MTEGGSHVKPREAQCRLKEQPVHPVTKQKWAWYAQKIKRATWQSWWSRDGTHSVREGGTSQIMQSFVSRGKNVGFSKRNGKPREGFNQKSDVSWFNFLKDQPWHPRWRMNWRGAEVAAVRRLVQESKWEMMVAWARDVVVETVSSGGMSFLFFNLRAL